jgi:hypothetical protein
MLPHQWKFVNVLGVNTQIPLLQEASQYSPSLDQVIIVAAIFEKNDNSWNKVCLRGIGNDNINHNVNSLE